MHFYGAVSVAFWPEDSQTFVGSVIYERQFAYMSTVFQKSRQQGSLFVNYLNLKQIVHAISR